MKKRLLSALLVLMMVAGVLAGCARPAADTMPVSQSPSPSAPPTAEASSPPPQVGGSSSQARIVTDMAGRTVELPEVVTSVATFGSCGVINTLIETLKCGGLISNDMAPRFTRTGKWHMQYEFAPQMKGAPVLQNNDDEILIEEVIRLNPDVCVTMQRPMIETLENIGMTVVYMQWDTVDDIKTGMTLLGEVFGKEALAAEYCEYYDTIHEKARQLLSGLAETDRKTVLYGNPNQLSNPHLSSNSWIEYIGGISVTKDAHKEGSLVYTTEDLLAWNPDVMIVIANQKEELQADSKINSITAIAEGEIYEMPTVGHMIFGSTEDPISILWGINKLYPELYSEEELSSEIRYFYSHFFDYVMDDEQIDAIIHYTF